MHNISYQTKPKEKTAVLAICYDFDKTLSPDDMQAQGYIQSVGYNAADFWRETNELAEQNDMDQNLAYMYKMIKEAEGNVLFKKEALEEYGSKVKLFPGVEDWFERIRDYGKQRNVIVEHYIISSGLKEMIEGASVAKKGAFEKIYASSFYYNEKGVAKWPAQVVNFTNKTQFLFRIEKGVLDVNDQRVNDSFAPEDLRVPFRNIVYIGDSDTDVPCMKLVNSFGGHSVGVFNPETNDKTKVFKMFSDNRIKYFAPADYREGEKLDTLIKNIIDRTSSNEILENFYLECKLENNCAIQSSSKEKQTKTDLINKLDNSKSFARTHDIIARLNLFEKWSDEEKETLYKIATSNSQVFYILKDEDVKSFYNSLLSDTKELSSDAEKVKKEIE